MTESITIAAPFTTAFARYVSSGDSITCTVDGFDLTATIHHDEDSEAPWDREDGHGPVTDWMSKDAKQAGYRVLNVDRGSARFYDFAEAVKIAKRDGWGAPAGHFHVDATPTSGQIAAAAAEHDFKVLKAWCNDEWAYCGIVVTVSKNDVELANESLWGVEYNYPNSDNSYLTEVANELASEALAAALAKLAQLVN